MLSKNKYENGKNVSQKNNVRLRISPNLSTLQFSFLGPDNSGRVFRMEWSMQCYDKLPEEDKIGS